MPAGAGIEIRGLVDFQRALRELNSKLPRELGTINKQVADFVVERAKGRASSLGPLWSRAARSLSSARKQRVALVRLGGSRYPEALGAEFGAIRNIPRLTARGEVRGNGSDAGYFLYPTIRQDTPEIIEMYGDLLERLAREAFPS